MNENNNLPENQNSGVDSVKSKFKVKGSYTYKVEKIVEADDKNEAVEIALNHSEPMCEWGSQDQDTYSEEVESAEEVSDE